MKNLSLILLLVLTACQKQIVKPQLPKITSASFSATSSMILRISQGATVIDGTGIIFSSTASPLYVRGEDAIYFQGAGIASLSTLSSDSVKLAFNELPYKAGTEIHLFLTSKVNARYKFTIGYNSTPYQFEITDHGRKCNIDSGFYVNIADTSTYGANRFKLLVK